MGTWWILVTSVFCVELRGDVAAESARPEVALQRAHAPEHPMYELRRQVREVYVRGTAEYKTLVRGAGVWEQQLSQGGPMLAIRPHSEEEVQATLRWATNQQYTVSVKSSGTQPGAWAMEGDILLHMGALSHVNVSGDASQPYLTVGGGARWLDVYAATDGQDLNAHGAGFSEGVVGSVLSGGASWWGYRHGLIADSVVAARIVLPNGDVVVAGTHFDPDSENKDAGVSEADILWSLRGGFPTGIVTQLTLVAFPQQKFIMGKLQCAAAPGPQRNNILAALPTLMPAMAALDATIQLKLVGSALWIFFVADQVETVQPLLGSEELSRCALFDLRGLRAESAHGIAVTTENFVHSRIADMPRYFERQFGSPSKFHGESRGMLLSGNPTEALRMAMQGAAQGGAYVDIEVWPMRTVAQDSVGHAFPHKEPILAIVRCQVLGVCPQLWMYLEPVATGLYAGQMSSTLPGDVVRVYGPTYRASHCMVQTLSPGGPRLLLGETPPHRPEDASSIARQAQMMLSCTAPFLAFDSCAPQHPGTVLVTGGSTGLGLVAVRMLAQQGLKVIIASRNEVQCADAAQQVYLETGYSPYCIGTDLESPTQVDRLVFQLKQSVPEGLDAAIFAAARIPDGTQVESAKKPDAAVRVVLGNVYLASRLVETESLAASARVVFVTSRLAFRKASTEVQGVLTSTKSFSETYVSAQALAAFGAEGLRLAYPTLSVGLAIASPVRTGLVDEAIRSGELDQALQAELEPAPRGEASLLASGSALLRALEPGFCSDGCGELKCNMPTEGVCAMWTEAQRHMPLPSVGSCPFAFHGSLFWNAWRDGLCGSIACAINVLVTLPAYHVLDVRVQTGQGLLTATASLRDHENGFLRFYSGLLSSLTLGPVVRFGDTFAHATAVALFGSSSAISILLTTILICIVYPLWRLLVYLVAFPDQVGLQYPGKKKAAATGEAGSESKVFKILYSTVLAAFPFWLGQDAMLMVLPQAMLGGITCNAIAGACAGFITCLFTVSGSGLYLRLPLCAFEGALFVVAWKLLCSNAEYFDTMM